MVEKKFPLYIPVIMILMVVLLCRDDLQSKEDEIANYIVKNQDVLTMMASAALDGNTDTLSMPDGINSISCWNGENTMVDFRYYSIGLGQTAGTHYGFYYSPADEPCSYGAGDWQLQDGEEGWSWMGEDDSYGYTKKIMDNWYYYEASF